MGDAQYIIKVCSFYSRWYFFATKDMGKEIYFLKKWWVFYLYVPTCREITMVLLHVHSGIMCIRDLIWNVLSHLWCTVPHFGKWPTGQNMWLFSFQLNNYDSRPLSLHKILDFQLSLYKARFVFHHCENVLKSLQKIQDKDTLSL